MRLVQLKFELTKLELREVQNRLNCCQTEIGWIELETTYLTITYTILNLSLILLEPILS